MRHEFVQVKRDTQTTYNRSFPEWEIPVLEFIFDAGNVVRTGKFEDVPGREYPDPALEFDRLERAYGKDAKSDIPHVASVYGQAGAGIRALRAAIDEARLAEAEASPTPPATRGERAEADALLA